MRNKILLVEDNEMIVKGLVYSLSKEGFETNIAYNAQEAESKIESNVYDIIILDVMLPDGNGFELCKHIKENKDIPIIFLTAKDDEKDVVNGFNLGADDYVIKPFRTMELISRIYNVLRRYNKDKNVIEIGQVRIDLEANRVYVDNKEVEFTALEYKILVLLYTNAGKTVTREKILDKIWDVAGNFVNDNTLTVYVKRIRDKLGKSDVIKTIKGIGYRVDK
jgi:DNA-binding response OmpR family regulator